MGIDLRDQVLVLVGMSYLNLFRSPTLLGILNVNFLCKGPFCKVVMVFSRCFVGVHNTRLRDSVGVGTGTGLLMCGGSGDSTNMVPLPFLQPTCGLTKGFPNQHGTHPSRVYTDRSLHDSIIFGVHTNSTEGEMLVEFVWPF